MNNDNKTNRYIMIDPCYFDNGGDYEDKTGFYHKACKAGEPHRERAKPYSFKHLEEECWVGSTTDGDGNYGGCCVDSGQLCLIPESLADKLVIKEHIETNMYKRVHFKNVSSKWLPIRALEKALSATEG